MIRFRPKPSHGCLDQRRGCPKPAGRVCARLGLSEWRFCATDGSTVLPPPTTAPGPRFWNATASDLRNSSRHSRPIRALRVTSATMPRAGMRSAHANIRCHRSDSPLRRRPRSAAHDRAIPWPALGVNHGRYRSAYACLHSQTDPSIGRSGLLWLPPRYVHPKVARDRGRQLLHRATRSPMHASTSVRVRDSAARTFAAERRRAWSRSQPLRKPRRHESWHRRSWHADRRNPSM